MVRTKDEQHSNSENGLSKQRKRIFNLILIALAVSIFFLLEFGLRIFNYGDDLTLFQKSENYPGYYRINNDVNLRYFSKLINTSPTNDIFLIEKPDTCYRIFVFGGSTTRGFPYQAGTSFPRILYYQLQDVFPDKRIEVVNLSASALNSYSYIDMMDEVLKMEPDAILIYGGHNEYYGALGVGSIELGGGSRWIKKTHLTLCKMRSYQLIQNLVKKAGSGSARDESAAGKTLMHRIVKDKDIVYNSDVFHKGVDQFHDNITWIAKKASKKNIPVVLSELVSNVHDHRPFKSSSAAGAPSAISVFQQAVELQANGDIEKAKDLFYQAKDLDQIRFRAPEAFNEVLHEISENYELPLVPMKKYFEEASPEEIIGNELILEHLHPNIEGQFLLADAFLRTLLDNKVIADKWNPENVKPISHYRNNWGFTSLDSLIGDLNVKFLEDGWPFRQDEAPNRFLQTYSYSGFVDSMALSYLKSDGKHIEDEHIKMVEYYAEQGRPDLAFEEYYSLIKLHPYIGSLYHDAARYLIVQRKYAEAYELINSAPLMEQDYYYHYMKGLLQVKLHVIPEAIHNLETALALNKNEIDPVKILTQLYAAYREKGDTANEQRISELIRQVKPKFETAESIFEKRIHPDHDIRYGDVLGKSMDLIREKKLEDAETLLLSLNKVEETFESAKLLSTVYLMQKNIELAHEFSLKAYKLYSDDIVNGNNLFTLSLSLRDFETAATVLNDMRIQNVDPEQIKHFEELFEKRLKGTAQ